MNKNYSDDILKVSYDLFIEILMSDIDNGVLSKYEATEKMRYDEFCDIIIKDSILGKIIINNAKRIVRNKKIQKLNEQKIQ